MSRKKTLEELIKSAIHKHNAYASGWKQAGRFDARWISPRGKYTNSFDKTLSIDEHLDKTVEKIIGLIREVTP